jgi:hypothetical protein
MNSAPGETVPLFPRGAWADKLMGTDTDLLHRESRREVPGP